MPKLLQQVRDHCARGITVTALNRHSVTGSISSSSFMTNDTRLCSGQKKSAPLYAFGRQAYRLSLDQESGTGGCAALVSAGVIRANRIAADEVVRKLKWNDAKWKC